MEIIIALILFSIGALIKGGLICFLWNVLIVGVMELPFPMISYAVACLIAILISLIFN